jgi:hypothetical protein
MAHPQMPSVTVGPNTFSYGSDPHNRPRIRIWVAGLAGTSIWYKITPDPKGTKAWEKKRELLFLKLAEALGAAYNTEGAWPQQVPVEADQTPLGEELMLVED